MHAERESTIWDQAVFARLSGLIGQEKVQGIASRFSDDLLQRFSDPTDRKRLEKEAHITHSSAGMLGFTELSALARDLETACQSDTEVVEALACVASAKMLVIETLKEHFSPDASWNPAYIDAVQQARADHQLDRD